MACARPIWAKWRAVALEDFGRASLAGLDAPAEPLRAALVAAEIHLAAQG